MERSEGDRERERESEDCGVQRRSGDEGGGGKGVERKARGCVWLMELETELTIPARGP